jgi:hypothetical protein
VLLYSLTGSDQLIFIPERIKDTVSEGFDQRIDYRYKSLKRRLENGGKRHRRKKASLVVNRGEYPWARLAGPLGGEPGSIDSTDCG